LLQRRYQSGLIIESYDLVVHSGEEQHAEAHRAGTVEHIFALEGELKVGPTTAPLSLQPSDYASYPADVPHLYPLQLWPLEHSSP